MVERTVFYSVRCDGCNCLLEDYTGELARLTYKREIAENAAKRADLERRIYPHLFRKTTATNMVRKGCPRDLVAFYLGHADGNTKTINKHYAATDPAQITQAFWQYGAAA